MPKKKKRRKALEQEAAEQEAAEEDNEEVAARDINDADVEFSFCNPDESDYHGVAELLKGGTWAFADVNFSELTDTLVEQGNIGTLVKSDADGNDSTVCGVLTALNLRQFRSLAWSGEVEKLLLAKAAKHADATTQQKLRSWLTGQEPKGEVGLLLSERFANLPLELVPPLHQALQDDIEWSCSTPECPEDERPFYRFTHFVTMVRYGGTAGADGGPQSAAGDAASTIVEPGACVRFEDDVYRKRASFSFCFPLPGKAGRGQPQEERLVFGITRKNFERAVKELHHQTPEAQS